MPHWTQERLAAMPQPDPARATSVGETMLPGGWASRVAVEWRTSAGAVTGRGHFYKRASK
jgi:hypothetical protein